MLSETCICLPLFKGTLSNSSRLVKILSEDFEIIAATSPFKSQDKATMSSLTDCRARSFTGFQESILIEVLRNISYDLTSG